MLALMLIVVVIVLAGSGDGGGGGGGGGGAKAPAGVWVVTGEKSLTRLNPKTGAVVATVRGVGRKLVGVATGQGAVWALDETGVQAVRVDPKSNRVAAHVPLPSGQTPNAVAAGPEGVYVATGPSVIARIDPATNRLSGREDGDGAYDLTTGLGFVWGSNFLDGDVKRITPSGISVTSVKAGLGKEPRFISAGPDAVWVLNSDRTMTRLSQAPGGAAPTARKFPTETSRFPGRLAVGEGAVWVTEGSTLWRYDPQTGRLLQTIDLGSSFVSNAIATGGGAVWLTNFSSGQVERVDARTRQVSQPISIPGKTTRVAVGP